MDTTGPEQPLSRNMAEAYPFTHSKREIPDLRKAWAYFEHQTLPRYIDFALPKQERKNCCLRVIRKFQKANKKLDRAEPGEDELPTTLYQPLWTPHKQLGDWGIGVGLYFSTLRALAVLTLLAGLLNIPNFMYFVSDEYSAGQPGVPDLLRGSAICTETSWVPCSDCKPGDFEDRRLAVNNETNTVFALKNNCDGATLQQGMVNYATLIFMIVGLVALNFYIKKSEIAFDEDEQTAQVRMYRKHQPILS